MCGALTYPSRLQAASVYVLQLREREKLLKPAGSNSHSSLKKGKLEDSRLQIYANCYYDEARFTCYFHTTLASVATSNRRCIGRKAGNGTGQEKGAAKNKEKPHWMGEIIVSVATGSRGFYFLFSASVHWCT